MAKMFYSLEEASEKLGIGEEQLKQMASNRQVQPFIDGDKLMFKRDQIDAISASAASGGQGLGDTGEISLSDSGAGDTAGIPLAASGDSGAGVGAADDSASGLSAADDSGPGETSEIPLAGLTGTGGAEAEVADTASGLTTSEFDDPGTSAGSAMGNSGLLGALGSGLDGGLGSSGIGSAGIGISSGLGSGLVDEEEVVDASDGTGLIDLAEEPTSPRNGQAAGHASGISVFDADEVETADPMAQTMMTGAVEGQGDELALESVGSGSGLLDLTREADDTSLGAELLDEIYPGTADVTAETQMETSDSSSVFDGSVTLEEEPQAAAEISLPQEDELEGAAPVVTMPAYGEVPDPVGSAMSSGFMFAATVLQIIGLIVIVFAIAGIPSAITSAVAQNQNSLYYYVGGAAAAWLVLGLLGVVIGKMMSR